MHCQIPDSSAESQRLDALEKIGILGTPAEREFDDITRLAAAALGVASAAVSLIDGTRQWFKSRHGIPFAETPRDVAFCTHAVAARELLVISDASVDTRFKDNPLVIREGGIRFYAGAPLIVESGHCLGTLCVFDPAPRAELSAGEQAILCNLAKLTADLIDSRRFRRMGEIAAKVVEATSDAVLAADQQGRIVYWNPAAAKMFGRDQSEALGQSVEIIIPARFAESHNKMFAQAAVEGKTRLVGTAIELIGTRTDGSEFPIELSLARWGNEEPDRGFAAIVRDISARKILEADREHSRAFLDTVIANLPAMLFVKDAETRKYLTVNRVAENVIGRSAQEMIGSTDLELFPKYGEGYEARDKQAVESRRAEVFESAFMRDDGQTVHLRTTRRLIDGPERPGQYILGFSEDVTKTRTAEAEVLRLAHYDTLTGLLNRASYAERMHRLVHDRVPFAMLSIDLDRFKAVNDQFGHPVGDEVLAQVGDRLRSLVSGNDWIARIGGDEFVAVLLGERLRDRAQTISDAIVAGISHPFLTERAVAHVGASVGVVLMPEDGIATEQLRENVDLALYRAKRQGRGNVCFFNAEMDATARDRRTLETDLREAIFSNEVALVYQPVLSTVTGQITSAEALARWTHPVRGPIRPDVFVPIAEECGLIDLLGEQLLNRACQDALAWPSAIRVAVNLSPLQFMSGNLVDKVRSAIASSGLDANRLQLEVTEGLVIKDVERTFAQLEELRELGIQILMDDFGVGYSSLSYFQRFPFDKVKIDKSFIDSIATSRAAKAIVQAVVGLGEALNMGVVAEGVETEEQMKLLTGLGCTHLQGFLFSHPMPVDAISAFLPDRSSPIAGQTAIE